MASSKETYCLCGQPYNVGQFMIECDCCREWFHGSCVNVKIYQSDDIDKYHCPKCSTTYGPSVLKIPTNNHRSDRYEIGAEARAAQVGTPAWVRALSARPMRPHPQVVQKLKGYQFTEEFVRDNGFTKPVLVDNPDGLEMMTPNPTTFTVRSVLRYCGPQLEVEVIDVRKQSSFRMQLADFVDYLETPAEGRDEKVLNVISLEFSDTEMSQLVEPPHTVRKLDWASRVWPASESRPCRPAVQKYCLLSAAGAYTDWHVDFGGTHVWYRVMRGGKVFYLAPPTPTNLALYQQWSAANNQNEKFFGDMIEWYGTIELNAGETLFIPSGWIHAVYTPTDSLVFGGNFLHSYAIDMQLQIYDIERRVETPMHYRYPLFEPINWYAGAHLLSILRRYNEESQDEDFTLGDIEPLPAPAEIPPLMLKGIKTLTETLKQWHSLKTSDTAKRDNVPKSVNSGQLVRELSKEIRILEKRTAASKDKDFKPKNISPTKSATKKNNQKKSIKLTLPKPIMHMAHNDIYPEENPKDIVYDNKAYIEKDIYTEQQYITQDVKFVNHMEEAKSFAVDGKDIVLEKNYMYQGYEEPLPSYVDANGYDKKNGDTILRIKMNNSPSSSRAPPPYEATSHSILKSHLTAPPAPVPVANIPTNRQQWTISKKDIGEYHHQILYTNDHMQPNDMGYQAMYAPEEIQEPYQYEKQYQYAYTVDPYAPQEMPQIPQVHVPQATYGTVVPQQVNNGYQEQLPSYGAALAQQYNPPNYQQMESKPGSVIASASVAVAGAAGSGVAGGGAAGGGAAGGGAADGAGGAVRRSRRGARRRHSPSFHYGDSSGDEHPPPSNTTYRNRGRPAPANGIESLIQASELADDPHTEDAAVAGMLSIGTRYAAPEQPSPNTTFGLAHANAKPEKSTNSKKRPRPEPEEEDPPEDVIKEVHRDDEYVYPALDFSSDEDEEEWTSTRRRNSRARHDSKTKADKDESWAPRARLGRLVPRSRSARHTRREAVAAALSAARHRAHPAPAHTHTHAHKPNNAKRAVLPVKSKRAPITPPDSGNKNNARLKKGMKTAKQRLGKILKLHKMMY